MRIKYAKVKYIAGAENKWMCSSCLTRFYSRIQARECAEAHNNKTVGIIKATKEDVEDHVYGEVLEDRKLELEREENENL